MSARTKHLHSSSSAPVEGPSDQSHDETLRKEALYAIGTVARILGVSMPTIRLYERAGLTLTPRTPSNHRRFSQGDIERIRWIRSMIHEEKVSIAAINRLFSLMPCWAINNCPAGERERCAAFDQDDAPCWSVPGQPLGCKIAQCRTCSVYTNTVCFQTIKKTIVGLTKQSPVTFDTSERAPAVCGFHRRFMDIEEHTIGMHDKQSH